MELRLWEKAFLSGPRRWDFSSHLPGNYRNDPVASITCEQKTEYSGAGNPLASYRKLPLHLYVFSEAKQMVSSRDCISKEYDSPVDDSEIRALAES